MAMLATQVCSFLISSAGQRAVIELRNDTRDARIAQQAFVDSEVSVAAYSASRDVTALNPYYREREVIASIAPAVLGSIPVVAPGAGTLGAAAQLRTETARMQRLWQRSLASIGSGDISTAKLLERERIAELTILRSSISGYLDRANSRSIEMEASIKRGESWALGLQLSGGLLTIMGLIFALLSAARERESRMLAIREANAARGEVECLFQMADLLQSAAGYEDANAVLAATALRLLPGLGGTLYVFNNSRDRLERATAWNHPEPEALPDFVAPSGCWALKRGKWHLNAANEGFLRCDHYVGKRAVLEMPMLARGELYGLLSFSLIGPAAEAELIAAKAIATALADAMSLALANIGLREKLRNQALRDQLTGLYNRRYMEDMLERLVALSERNARPFSLIMIDLDHFKRLNDEHGHPAGDAALRSASDAVVSGLRDTDIACRYGGEELAVLLPDCDLHDAMLKADSLRARIENCSSDGLRVTASMGVATIPDTSGSSTSLVAMADKALYEAKRAGRNRVMAAQRNGFAADVRRPLAVG